MTNSKHLWWVNCGIVVAVISTALGAFIYLFILLNRTFSVSELEDFSVNTVVPMVLETVNDTTGMPTAITPPTPSSLTNPSESYNLILAGIDRRSDRIEPDCPTCLLVHTDAFVYVNISMVNELRVTMVSIPRELYLHVDGIIDSQVSQLYARGGLEWIKSWSEGVLGVEIDGVMVIDMEAFVEVVDKMGGVGIRVHESFKDKCGSDWYEYEANYVYEFDGFEALCYARMRMYNPDGYFSRQERHNEVVIGIIQKLGIEFMNSPLAASVMTVSTYFEYIETDMPPEFIAQIVGETAIFFLQQGKGLTNELWDSYSISRDMLELYPRPSENSPYLYKPTFVISDWIQCLLDTPFECEIE